MLLKDKVALVTGGGTGIGAAITRRFIEEGARVCISGRRLDKLEQEARAFLPGSISICPGDVSKIEDVRRMVATVLEIAGKIDILVNNAATDVFGSIIDLSPDDWRRVMETNLTGPFLTMRESLPYMIKNGGGSIINISSLGGLRCSPGAPAYDTSKAGLIMLSQQAALEYGPYHIRCNALCPGATRTAMLEEAVSDMAAGRGTDLQTMLKRFSSPLPLKRIADPEEIAKACSFLASEDSSFITGAVLVIDGGSSVVDVSAASLGYSDSN
jgi:meso-butanediol dehydrogenase/(S,S)-butanediol dehydrogenase/diacetyl reductase